MSDPAYQADQEDLLILFRPLFFTSFMLADQVVDNDCYGATSLVVSSASSKTAYAAAVELRGRGPRLVGLTSPGNVEFTRALGCYDEVLPYDGITALDPVPTAYLDLSGAPATRAALRRHLGDRLVRDIAVGLTNQIPNADAAGEVFFAPVQMRKRRLDWVATGSTDASPTPGGASRRWPADGSTSSSAPARPRWRVPGSTCSRAEPRPGWAVVQF